MLSVVRNSIIMPRRVQPELLFIAGNLNSEIDLGTIHDNENDWWVSFEFKLTAGYDSGESNDMFFLGKFDDATNYLTLRFYQGNGQLYLAHKEGNGEQAIGSTESSWKDGVWYHCIASCSTTSGQRMIINGGTAVTAAANQTAISLTAAMFLGDLNAGSSAGLGGRLRNISMGNDELTGAEEVQLNAGIIPADATEFYRLNEGHGTTAIDLGTGGNDGTIDTACRWETGLRGYVRY